MRAPDGALVAARGDVVAVLHDRQLDVRSIGGATTRGARLDLDAFRLAVTAGPSPLVVATSRDGVALGYSPESGMINAGWRARGVVDDAMISAGSPALLFESAGWRQLVRIAGGRTVVTDGGAAITAVSSDGLAVASASGRTARLWLAGLRAPDVHGLPLLPWNRFRVAEDGTAIAYATEDGTLTVVDFVTDARATAKVPDALVIGFAADRGTIAVGATNGAITTWSFGTSSRTIGVARGPIQDLAAIDERRAFVQVDKRVWIVEEGREPVACGERPALAAHGTIAVIGDDAGASICDASTGALRPLVPSASATRWRVSADASRVVAVIGGRVGVWHADGTVDSVPAIAGAIDIDLDRRGARIAVTSVDGLVVVETETNAAISLARSAGARIAAISPSGQEVAALLDHDLVAWDVARPDQPYVLGTLVDPLPFELAVSDDGRVVSILESSTAGYDVQALPWGRGLTASVWPAAPATDAELADWLRRVTPPAAARPSTPR
jgi:hypothetical protein